MPTAPPPLASQPTMSRWENIRTTRELVRLTGCQWAPKFPQIWVLPQFRCRFHATIRARSKSRPARPYIDRLMSLSLLILPSTGPVLQGSVNAARTASISRMRPRAKEPMALPSAWVSHGSSSVASRLTRMSWNRRARSAASAIAGEAARTASTKRASSERSASLGAVRSRTAWRDDGGFQCGRGADGAAGCDSPSRSRILIQRRKPRASP